MTSFVPALCSSIVEVCFTQPLDVIKTHRQTGKHMIYTFKNMYAGFVPRAIGNIPSRTIFLYSQQYFASAFSHGPISDYKILAVPICSGLCQTIVDTPVEILKINKIMNRKETFIYRGFIPHSARNITFLFPVYYLRKNFGSDSVVNNSLCGAAGGLIGSYMSHPFDTLKTMVQSGKKHENVKYVDIMKGAHIRASMSMVNMFISFTVFEIMKKYNVVDVKF